MKNTIIKMSDFLAKQQKNGEEENIFISNSRHMSYCILYYCALTKKKVYLFEIDFKEKKITKYSSDLTQEEFQYLSSRYLRISKERAILLVKEILDLQYLLELPIQYQYAEFYQKASQLKEKEFYKEEILNRKIFNQKGKFIQNLHRALIEKDYGLIFEFFTPRLKEKYSNRWEFFTINDQMLKECSVNYFLTEWGDFYEKKGKTFALVKIPIYYVGKMYDTYYYLEFVRILESIWIDRIIFLDYAPAKNKKMKIEENIYTSQFCIKENQEFILELFDFSLIGEKENFKIYKKKMILGQIYALLRNETIQFYARTKEQLEIIDKQFATLKVGIVRKEKAESEKKFTEIIYEIMNDKIIGEKVKKVRKNG